VDLRQARGMTEILPPVSPGTEAAGAGPSLATAGDGCGHSARLGRLGRPATSAWGGQHRSQQRRQSRRQGESCRRRNRFPIARSMPLDAGPHRMMLDRFEVCGLRPHRIHQHREIGLRPCAARSGRTAGDFRPLLAEWCWSRAAARPRFGGEILLIAFPIEARMEAEGSGRSSAADPA